MRMASASKKTVHASEQARPDVARARAVWKEAQPFLDPARLVFLDETGTSTNMAPLRGWGPRGERLVGLVPHGHWKVTTLVAGLREDGLTAPLVVDRPMNGDIFKAYVQQCLVPTLSPGDVVIMDNLSSHKVAGIRELIEAAGAKLLYLPPYSPDLNPIEQVFAKLKQALRRLKTRSVTDLWDAIGSLLDDFQPQECLNYFKNSGYASA